MHPKRLNVLASFLRVLAPSKLSMDVWWLPGQYCGTIACAAGWATTIPEFQSEGFKLDERLHVPFYRYRFGDLACLHFFNLTSRETLQIFSSRFYPPRYIKPIDVAERIEQLLRGQEVSDD